MQARILYYALLLTILINPASADPITLEKRDLVDKMLEINQTAQLVPLMSSMLSRQIISALSTSSKGVDDDLAQLVHTEVKTVIREEFVLNNKLNDIFYALYDEYFTTKQMSEIVKFYSSVAGKQLIKHTGDISRRSQQEAQKHAKKVGQIVQQRVLKRLDNVMTKLDSMEKEDK